MTTANHTQKLTQFSELSLNLTDSVCALGELADILDDHQPVYCLIQTIHQRINSAHNDLLAHFDGEFDRMYEHCLKMAENAKNGAFEGDNVALLHGSSRFKSGVPSGRTL